MVSLTWSAQAGEHEWRVEVWGDNQLKASRSGSLEVSWTPTSLFEVELIAYPTELEGGGTVYFTVKVFNYVNSAYSIRGYVKDEDGSKVYPEDGGYFEARLPANGNYTAHFDLPVSGIGNHTYTLYVDNYGGESHTDSVKIEVKQGNGELQQIYFVCSDMYFDYKDGTYKATLTCKAGLYNPSETSIGLYSVAVDSWSIDIPALRDALSGPWSVSYPNEILPQNTEDVTFIIPAEASLSELERKLWGANMMISIGYTVKWGFKGYSSKYSDFSGADIIQIKQDNSDVIKDVGGSAVIVVAVPILAEGATVGELVKALVRGYILYKLKDIIIDN